MSTYESTIKNGHPAAGLVLGILGIAIAVILTMVFGIYAGALAAVLGILAVLLGIGARKGNRGGMGAIITGAIAVVLAVTMTFTTFTGMKALQKAALETGKAPVFAETFDNPWAGMSGVIFKLADQPEKLNAVTRELEALKDYSAPTPVTAAQAVSVAAGC